MLHNAFGEVTSDVGEGASYTSVVSVVVKAAEKYPGTHTTYCGTTGDAVRGGPQALPNVRIHDITRNNDATDVSGQVISGKRKKQETKGEDE
ncbi:MAG TPA: hypothetical protein DIS79_08600 [Bacteroidetes bacterium]|nr:hypothetical protein [Bacteroidota bacterium]HRK06105.1 hypothetical protein [Chlorobiota bacterium]